MDVNFFITFGPSAKFSITSKYQIRLKRLSSDKRSSLFYVIVKKEKIVYTIGIKLLVLLSLLTLR